MKGEMQANDDGNHSKGLLTTQAAHIRGGYVAAGVVATLMYCINIGDWRSHLIYSSLTLIFVVMDTQQLSFCIVSCSFHTLNLALTILPIVAVVHVKARRAVTTGEPQC